MRLFLAIAVVLALSGVDRARAELIQMGKHTVAEVRSACGASFEPAADGGGYGCQKDCKNSQGKTVSGGCKVACDNNNNCTGQTPNIIVHPPGKITLNAVLSGFKSAVSGQPTGKPKRRPERLLSPGLLEAGPGLSTTGPAGTGTPMGKGSSAPGQFK
jgi:hypothetical protein